MNAAPQGGGGSQPVDCEHQEGYVAADSRQNSPTKIPAVLPAGAAFLDIQERIPK